MLQNLQKNTENKSNELLSKSLAGKMKLYAVYEYLGLGIDGIRLIDTEIFTVNFVKTCFHLLAFKKV